MKVISVEIFKVGRNLNSSLKIFLGKTKICTKPSVETRRYEIVRKDQPETHVNEYEYEKRMMNGQNNEGSKILWENLEVQSQYIVVRIGIFKKLSAIPKEY